MKSFLYLSIAAGLILPACQQENPSVAATAITQDAPGKPKAITATKVAYGPLQEAKCYKLFNGYNSSDDFEASGIYALGSYYYVVFDNRFKIGQVLSSLPINSSANSLVGSGSGSSNFEGIAYDNYGTPNWYVGIETEKNGSSYYPKIREYDLSLNYQSASWTDVAFSSANSNKGFEGIAYIRRNSQDYLLGLVEGTGKICVMLQNGSSWTKVAEFYVPAIFTDYSDIALYGNKLAVLSQEDARVWVGTLSSTSWAVTGNSTVYTFPTGDSNGNVGAVYGTKVLYANMEGVSFINDSTIVTCTDKADSSQPSYQQYKEQSIQTWKLR